MNSGLPARSEWGVVSPVPHSGAFLQRRRGSGTGRILSKDRQYLQMMMQPRPITLFLSYASKDESLLHRLEVHLRGLKRQGFISTWQRHLVLPGTEREQEVNKQLSTASIILLLISADFLDSDYCYGIEMEQALARHNADNTRVIPIIVRPCDWSHAPFAQLQCLPLNGKAITTWSDRELAFKDIAIQLRRIVEGSQRSQVGIPLHQGRGRGLGDNLQTLLGSQEDEQADRNKQREDAIPHLLHVFPEFHRCQKKVGELKSVHNMLHEIEIQLEGLSATIQQLIRDERRGKAINQPLPDFGYVEIMWRQVTLKIDNLAYFAAEVIEILEDERLSFDSNAIRGAPWIKDLFVLQQSFEVGVRDQNIPIVRNLSNELLMKCRSHLYRIDKRLMEAVKELDLSSEFLRKGGK